MTREDLVKKIEEVYKAQNYSEVLFLCLDLPTEQRTSYIAWMQGVAGVNLGDFGLEKKWAKEFEDIYTVPPKWYSDGMNNAFAVGMFASSLSDFSKSTSTSMFSSPVTYSASSGSSFGSSGSSSGSSGGGSSGGGGGGGGGGSW